MKQKSIQFQKQKKWIAIVQEKYGKTQTFQIYGLGEAEIQAVPKIWEK